jgi:putative ABC transport system permease protein
VTLAYWVIGVVGPAVPEVLYRVGEVTLDGTVLAYTAAVTLATPFLFGLGPALRAGRTDPIEAIRPGATGATGSGNRQRGRKTLVAVEVALAVVLVTGAGLMLRSFAAVQTSELGFDPDRLLTVEVQLPERQYAGGGEVDTYYDRAVTELTSIPGVDHVGSVLLLPMNHEMAMRDIALGGREPPSQQDWPLAIYNRASPGYFEALGASLRAGRTFQEGDGEGVAVVSESLARRHLGPGSPIGTTLLVGTRGQTEELTVIGVVEDVQHADLIHENRPQFYLPLTEGAGRRRFLVLRTERGPEALTGAVRSRLATLDPGLPVVIRPMAEIVRENTFVWSMSSVVLGSFGIFALFLASLGIYGVVAYSVERRRREMGIRLALGATGGGVRRLMVGEGLRLAVLGAAVGLALAALAGRFMEAILYQVAGLDPVALAGTLALFTAVALGASWIPARRASRAEVMTVLRE